MKDIRDAFVELESEASFEQLGRAFRGTIQSNTLFFDNPVVTGVLINRTPEIGLWIRKWKLKVFEKITLQREVSSSADENKFSILYFLNPSIFNLKIGQKKIALKNYGTGLLVSNQLKIDLSVLPKQPFYLVDITFTTSWLMRQFEDCDANFRNIIQDYIKTSAKSILMQSCKVDEYKILHELDELTNKGWENELYIRSRIYQLLTAFFKKLIGDVESKGEKQIYHYEQIMLSEAILMNNLKSPPKIEEIAKCMNLSPSSLLRGFKRMFGKTLYKYHLENKMEFAKKLILEKGITIKKVAETMGYKQTSAFIQSFTKQFNCSPGNLKA